MVLYSVFPVPDTLKGYGDHTVKLPQLKVKMYAGMDVVCMPGLCVQQTHKCFVRVNAFMFFCIANISVLLIPNKNLVHYTWVSCLYISGLQIGRTGCRWLR